jgi:hypothetical protein
VQGAATAELRALTSRRARAARQSRLLRRLYPDELPAESNRFVRFIERPAAEE